MNKMRFLPIATFVAGITTITLTVLVSSASTFSHLLLKGDRPLRNDGLSAMERLQAKHPNQLHYIMLLYEQMKQYYEQLDDDAEGDTDVNATGRPHIRGFWAKEATFPLLTGSRTATVWFKTSERWRTEERPSRVQLVAAAFGPVGHRIFDVTEAALDAIYNKNTRIRDQIRLKISKVSMDVQLAWLLRRQPPLLLLFYGDLQPRPPPSRPSSPPGQNNNSNNDRPKRHVNLPYIDVNKGRCRLHEWALTFDQLGWQDWVVAPPAIQINYCAGECNVLPNNHTSPHALMRGFYHIRNGPQKDLVPKPCCAPTRLKGASLITIDKGVIELHAKERMVALECGCV